MRMSLALVAVLSLGVWHVGSAVAGIEIVSESAAVDRDAGIVRFSLELSGSPDFWTLDEFGRVADSFQYEIDGNWEAEVGLPPEGLDAVVRGDEIHAAEGLRIRDANFGVTPDTDPIAGGWGGVRAEVPFQLDETWLTFEASLADIGDEGDGYFAYRVFTTEYGLTTSRVETRLLPPGEEPGPIPGPGPGPVPVPLPAPLHAAVVAVLVLGAGRVVRRLPLRVR